MNAILFETNLIKITFSKLMKNPFIIKNKKVLDIFQNDFDPQF